MAKSYRAADIEVLSGLDPVRRRPGMYTDTARPNHLAHEVVDNSVDEALAGHAKRIAVRLFADGSLEVADDGRGMPVDLHPKEKIPGVELILTRLHAGGKFSDKHYQFAGGLHGVGVSVVNALSKQLEVWIRRDGREYNMSFASGKRRGKLEIVGKVGKVNTGTTIRFWPDPKYFDSAAFSVPRLKHVLKAKAVLCPGLEVTLEIEKPSSKDRWCYEQGLEQYLIENLGEGEWLPAEPFTGSFAGPREAIDWALVWQPDGELVTSESYVNLIPTAQGGTHVNGLRAGLTEALREFAEFRGKLPRGVKLAPEDVWEGVNFVLSLKMQDPQFAGQTKERLGSREVASFVSGIVKDTFALWLNRHPETGDEIAELAIAHAQARAKAAKKVTRKRIVAGPALPGKLADCTLQEPELAEIFLVEGDSAGGSAKQARDRETQAVMPLRGKILNTWEVDPGEILASQEVHNISIALGIDPGATSLEGLRYYKVCILADADSDGQHIATLLCALFLRHFPALVEAGHVFVAMPPLFRIDVGKEVHYALDEAERDLALDRIEAEKKPGKVSVTRFKGLGEMDPMQLRETTMARETRRLVKLTVSRAAAAGGGENVDGPGKKRGKKAAGKSGSAANDAGRDPAYEILDKLLAKKRAADRRAWLEEKGNLAEV
jgi:topoisomerase-4 subunit B